MKVCLWIFKSLGLWTKDGIIKTSQNVSYNVHTSYDPITDILVTLHQPQKSLKFWWSHLSFILATAWCKLYKKNCMVCLWNSQINGKNKPSAPFQSLLFVFQVAQRTDARGCLTCCQAVGGRKLNIMKYYNFILLVIFIPCNFTRNNWQNTQTQHSISVSSSSNRRASCNTVWNPADLCRAQTHWTVLKVICKKKKK